MFYGNLVNGMVILTTDVSKGRPIIEVDAPTNVPTGYHSESRFMDSGSSITQVWDIVPDAGTPQDAAITLAMMQAETLSDEEALKVPALYPEWSGNAVVYVQGNRVLYNGTLYKVLQSHTSQIDWNPVDAPSLFAKVLVDQSGGGSTTTPEWEQPNSTNPYAKGDKVTHNGKTWESQVDNNVWEPGVSGTESLWKEV